MIEIKRKQGGTLQAIELKESNGVYYFQFPLLEQSDIVTHGFSTKIGGVSKGAYAEMNLGVSRGDDPEAVLENYKRITNVLHMPWERVVLSHQTHTTNIRVVKEEDAGTGLVKQRNYENVDGLITNVPNLPLVTFYADCVPLYFVDPVHQAIGLSHSGWRGTVNRMGQCTIEAMKTEYDSRPEDILACIGPSICQECYEVGEEVAKEFEKAFLPEQRNQVLKEKPDGKYLLDLWKANEIILLEAGIKKEHLAITDICTKCNPNLLYSHRVMGNRRGNLAAFLCLKK
ncbi:Laccase domain protein [Clostridiales bacterium CHKCI001]|nr:Laccase domain protein [Clostridiales bacterium CHKCI001]